MLILQVCLPAAFFLLMWIPRYYIKPIPHAEFMPPSSIDIESRWWSGPAPYSGELLLWLVEKSLHCMAAC